MSDASIGRNVLLRGRADGDVGGVRQQLLVGLPIAVNVLRPGGNYGWPVVTGVSGRSGFVDPLVVFPRTVALRAAPRGAAASTSTRSTTGW